MLNPLRMNGRYMYNQGLESMKDCLDITHEHLDRDISALEIDEYVMKSLRNRKASGSDGIAGELIKYGGNGMIMMLKELFQLIWDSEYIPERWGEGIIISLFQKGDQEDPGNYRGITLLNVVGKLFNKVLIIINSFNKVVAMVRGTQ